MEEANAGAEGFPDVQIQKKYDFVAYARKALLVVTNLLGYFGTRGFEHALFAGLVGAIVVFSRQCHEASSSGHSSVVAHRRIERGGSSTVL